MKKSIGLSTVWEQVRSKQPGIHPNPTFCSKLWLLERQLFGLFRAEQELHKHNTVSTSALGQWTTLDSLMDVVMNARKVI
jgi:hypothetical protein